MPSPHGHGLVAARSKNFAGMVTLDFARAKRTTPSSSGWRNASNTVGANSPNSSKNNTPFVASEISPGRMVIAPPPTIATSEVEWCGARNGGNVIMPVAGKGICAAECTMVVATASTSVNVGRMPLMRCASIDFPAPGGPTNNK